MSEILVVGSVAYDTISTPAAKKEHLPGGSANYFSLAASMYSKVNVVGVVGEDFAQNEFDRLESRNVDVSGLQKVSGKTFHWEGRYEDDMNDAITVETQLNVLESFNPVLPENYKKSKYLFLANIDPELQMRVLEQVDDPAFVGVDTMNLWIDTKQSALKEILKKVDVLLLNEGEARQLAGTWNTVDAIQTLCKMGPKGVVVKRGEYGFMLYTQDAESPHEYFVLPAFPVKDVVDPTGAGDTFAGGFFGYLARLNQDWNVHHLRDACVHGCLMASFTVQDFGIAGIESLDWTKFEERQQEYRKVINFQG